MQLRKLVTNDWGHVSPGLFLKNRAGWGTVDLGRLWLGSSNAEKWSNHQNKKFCINNSVKALIMFNEGHQGLLKLCMHLKWRVSVWEKKGCCVMLHCFREV